ncbi:hypothetical protein ABRR14_005077 [Escherichia coli]
MNQKPSLACAVSADLSPESELGRDERNAAALKAIRGAIHSLEEKDLVALLQDVQKELEMRSRNHEDNKLVDQGLNAHHQQANLPDWRDYF